MARELQKNPGMKEMIHKIIVIALLALSALLHPEQHVFQSVYNFAMQHSETVRTAAEVVRIIQSL